MPSVALLIKDPLLQRVVAEQLSDFWTVSSVSDWADASTFDVDALLVDAGLVPLKSTSAKAPLVFVLASAGEGIPSFEISETFAKPLRIGRLASRLQWHLTSYQQMQDPVLALGDVLFAPRQKTVQARDGEVYKLTEKEASLLGYLARSRQGVGRDELLAEVWGYDGGIDTHTLETHIYRLRSIPCLVDLVRVKQGVVQLSVFDNENRDK